MGNMNALKSAAEQGDAEAQFDLGVAYCRGLGIPQDFVEAVKWCLMRRSRDMLKRRSP